MPTVSTTPITNVSSETMPLAPPQTIPLDPSLQSQIQARAYELYQQRGMSVGHALDDWLQAEQEISQISTFVTAKAA